MTLLMGVLLSLFIAWVFVACLRLLDVRSIPGWVWFLLAAGAACLLFRPDEEVEAGEDAGAYFNAAVSYASYGHLNFEDPAFTEVAPEEQRAFRYGHGDFFVSKDNCLWVQDLQMQKRKPWFFPAYSLLMAVPIAAGFPYGAFWIAPVLAILIGVLLAGLARWLTGRAIASAAAFVFYLLHPAVIWNARCMRAEWPASFLILAGLVLWLVPMVPGKPASRATGFLSGLSLGVAMLFHVTALYVVIPMTLASLWLTRRAPFWAGWWGGLVAGGGLLLAQILWVTDPYWMKLSWIRHGGTTLFLPAAAVVLAVVAGLRFWWSRVVAREKAGVIAGLAMSVCFGLLVGLSIPLRTEDGGIPGLPAWAISYISLTDFRGVMNMSSRPWFIAALLGTLVLCARRDVQGRLGRWIFFALAPASMTIGWVNNYMFETRRMVTFLVPLLVLSLLALVFVIGEWAGARLHKRWPRAAARPAAISGAVICLLTAGLLAVSAWGKESLYTTWNNRGTFDFYRKVSDRVRDAGDFLFAEYTQAGAPIERLADRPLLPLAWDYRSDDDYRVAEQVMARLVAQHPERRHVLITPFSGAAIPGAGLEPIFSDSLRTRQIERLKRAVPTRVQDRVRTLHVYRVAGDGSTATNASYVRIFDGGRLGLAGAANKVSGRILKMRGIAVTPDQARTLRFASSWKVPGRVTLAFVFAIPSGAVPQRLDVERAGGAAPSRVRRYGLGPGWEVVECEGNEPARGAFEFSVSASERVYLSDAFALLPSGRSAVRVKMDAEQESFEFGNTDSQWLKAHARVALPVYSEPSRVWMLATHGRRGDPVVECEIGLENGGAERQQARIETGWTWSVFARPGVEGAAGAFRWHEFITRPAWDPNEPGFPRDLGVRVQRICVAR